jgi:hypothetical protein
MAEKNILPRDLQRIEKRLQAVLQPVRPPADFVHQLRMQLESEMDRKTASKKVQTGLLVAGGLVSLVVLVVTVIRTIITWPTALESLTRKMPKLRKREGAASV